MLMMSSEHEENLVTLNWEFRRGNIPTSGSIKRSIQDGEILVIKLDHLGNLNCEAKKPLCETQTDSVRPLVAVTALVKEEVEVSMNLPAKKKGRPKKQPDSAQDCETAAPKPKSARRKPKAGSTIQQTDSSTVFNTDTENKASTADQKVVTKPVATKRKQRSPPLNSIQEDEENLPNGHLLMKKTKVSISNGDHDSRNSSQGYSLRGHSSSDNLKTTNEGAAHSKTGLTQELDDLALSNSWPSSMDWDQNSPLPLETRSPTRESNHVEHDHVGASLTSRSSTSDDKVSTKSSEPRGTDLGRKGRSRSAAGASNRNW